jgi:uncharacterized protein (DUF1697 family)
MKTYVALLRGVNVGGRKVVMSDLRRVFVELGHSDVTTYLQSGNVVFRSPVDQPVRLAGDIEERIAENLAVSVTVLVRTGADLDRVVAGNPFGGPTADLTKLHVTFLAEPPDPGRLVRLQPESGEPDEFSVSGREVYLRCPNGYGRTKLNNAFFERRFGVAATTRNWNTVTKLRELLGG